MEKGGVDTELTNLNWVAGTPVPINFSVSPTEAHSKPQTGGSTAASSLPIPPTSFSSSSLVSPIASRLPPMAPTLGVQRSRPATARAPQKKQPPRVPRSSTSRKPPCSYTCLIAMALKSSAAGCLPVNEIYKYIE